MFSFFYFSWSLDSTVPFKGSKFAHGNLFSKQWAFTMLENAVSSKLFELLYRKNCAVYFVVVVQLTLNIQ